MGLGYFQCLLLCKVDCYQLEESSLSIFAFLSFYFLTSGHNFQVPALNFPIPGSLHLNQSEPASSPTPVSYAAQPCTQHFLAKLLHLLSSHQVQGAHSGCADSGCSSAPLAEGLLLQLCLPPIRRAVFEVKSQQSSLQIILLFLSGRSKVWKCCSKFCGA